MFEFDETYTTETPAADQQPAAEADQADAFLSGWDDENGPATEEQADQPEAEEGGEAPKEENPAEEGKTAEKADDPKATGEEAKPAEEGGGSAPASWTYKHMGEEKTMTTEDITPELLQKAADYDRIREKYDESKPVMDMFRGFAQKANMAVPEYLRYIRAEAKKASGMTEEDAKKAVELEDREAAVAQKEAQQEEADAAKKSNEAKVKTDLEEFAKTFPEVYERARQDPKTIPPEVWAMVRKEKLSLTAAWSRYAVDQANAREQNARRTAEASQLNEKNAGRSAGSMQSAGSEKTPKDAFLQGWDD